MIGLDAYRLADMPEPKEQFGFEELDGVLYAVAGVTTGNAHSKTLYAYDIATNTWSQKTDAPTALQSPVFRAVGTKLYLIGGYDSSIPLKYDTVYEYDPGTDSWAEKEPMPTAREDMASAVVGGKIYVFGGLTNPGHTLASAVEVYDPTTDTWETKDPMPDARALGDFGVSYDGKAYLVSGTDDMSGYSTNLKASPRVDEYDPDTDTWEQKANIPVSKCYTEIAALDGRLYAVNGVYASTTDYTGSYAVYDVAANTLESHTFDPYAARGIGLTADATDLYVAGGYNGTFLTYLFRLTPYEFEGTEEEMALENFTTYVESDGGEDNITVAANSITWNDLNRAIDEDRVYKDFGAGYFSGDFVHSFKFTTPAAGDAQDGAWVYTWVLTNAINSPTEIDAANGDFQGFFFVNAAVDTPRFALDITEDGTQRLDNSSTINFSTAYYITIVRDDDGGANETGQLTAYICTGNYYQQAGYSLFDTLTLDCDAGEQNDFRYIFATVPRGGTTNADTDGVVADFNLSASVAAYVELAATGGFTVSGTATLTAAEVAELAATGGLTMSGTATLVAPGFVELAATCGFTVSGTAALTRTQFLRFTTDPDFHVDHPADFAVTNTLAAGERGVDVSVVQGTNALTGTLRGIYDVVTNGEFASSGTIRAIEAKARAATSGLVGGNVGVLEGASISADAKDKTVTTLRGAEFILGGVDGASVGEAVGIRIANNFQESIATTQYGLQIYADSTNNTADIQLSSGGLIGGLTGAIKIDTGPGNVANYSNFEADGVLEFNGDARVWDDINIGAISLSGPTGQQPDIAEMVDVNGDGTGIYTYSLATDEFLHGSFELEHRYAEGEDLYFHVHFSLDDAVGGDSDNVEFTLTYSILRDGVAVPAATTINTGDVVVDVDYGAYRADFPAVDGTNFKIGDQVCFKITRTAPTADDFAGELLLQTIGIHCLMNTVGSRTLETK